jgi:5-methyltetrahydropteroyltriglutamate--homocysteine methyltransferase
MLKGLDLPLLPTQVIGSHGVPSWLWIVRDAIAEEKLGPADIAETLRDAVDIALMDMTAAGVDIISDGEFYRADFTWNFHDRITGMEPLPFERRLGYPGPDQVDAFRCVRPLDVPNGYGLVPEVEYLRTRTQQPFITTLQGPVTQAFRIAPGDVYKDKGEVAWALVPFINRELKAAVAAGAQYLQIDEPAFWIMPGGLPEMVEVFNASVEAVEAPVGVHFCFGNFRGRPAISQRSYREFAPYFRQLAADVIHLEFANRCMCETELWAEHGGDKILCAGVIDVKGRSVEPPEIVANRIRTVLQSCRPEKLWLAPDCGFSQTARGLAVEKLRSLVAGARIVRDELARGKGDDL